MLLFCLLCDLFILRSVLCSIFLSHLLQLLALPFPSLHRLTVIVCILTRWFEPLLNHHRRRRFAVLLLLIVVHKWLHSDMLRLLPCLNPWLLEHVDHFDSSSFHIGFGLFGQIQCLIDFALIQRSGFLLWNLDLDQSWLLTPLSTG